MTIVRWHDGSHWRVWYAGGAFHKEQVDGDPKWMLPIATGVVRLVDDRQLDGWLPTVGA
jgi:hypothetical protein